MVWTTVWTGRLGSLHTTAHNPVGFTENNNTRIGWIDWTRASLTRLQNNHPPAFLHPQELYRPALLVNLLKNPSSTTFETEKNTKCLEIISATTSTLLIILTMCGITIQCPTRSPKSPKYWPGYLHSNPRYGTTISKPAGSTTWETDSCRLRNIRTGLVVSVGVILVVQLYFATEVQGLAKHTFGKREYTRGSKGIANTP